MIKPFHKSFCCALLLALQTFGYAGGAVEHAKPSFAGFAIGLGAAYTYTIAHHNLTVTQAQPAITKEKFSDTHSDFSFSPIAAMYYNAKLNQNW